ncbi:MAG: transposase, partial [Actinomycetota bacterium]|nr:transposase [Actinomycetota bacterium]
SVPQSSIHIAKRNTHHPGTQYSRCLLRFLSPRHFSSFWKRRRCWWHSRISNGLLEDLHSLVQAAKRRARGYRSTRNYIAMIHLTAGKLDIASTHAK